jgi:hypothetical protein
MMRRMLDETVHASLRQCKFRFQHVNFLTWYSYPTPCKYVVLGSIKKLVVLRKYGVAVAHNVGGRAQL